MAVNPSINFFFMHIMKTGGTSFSQILARNFSEQERYPDCCLDADADFGRRTESYIHVPSLVRDANAQRPLPRIVAGHVPYATRELLDGERVTLTLLRHPVDRTVSYLKHCKRYHPEHADAALHDIYEKPWFRAMFIDNYQTRILSMTAAESVADTRLDIEPSPLPTLAELKEGASLSPEAQAFQQRNPARFILELFNSCTGAIEVDEGRLQRARANLDAIEVVGVTEHYNAFLGQLQARYQWLVPDLPRERAGSDERASGELATRIAQDNWADMALYEHARGRALTD